MTPWWQSSCWLHSPECHHLCLLLMKLTKRPSTAPSLPISIIAECVSGFLKPQLLAVGCADGHMHIICASSGEAMLSMKLGGGAVRSVAYAPHGQSIAAGCGDGHLRIMSAQSGLATLSMHLGGGPVKCVAYSPCGRHIAAGCSGLRVIHAASRAILLNLSTGSGGVMSVAYSPSGQRLAAGCDDSHLRILDTETWTVLQSFRMPLGSGCVRSVAYAPCEQSVVVGCHGGCLYILSAESGAIELSLQPLESMSLAFEPMSLDESVTSVAYEPHRKRLAFGRFDFNNRRLRILPATSKSCIADISIEGAWSIAFAPGGSRIATGCFDGHVRVLTTDTGDIVMDKKIGSSWCGGDSAVWSVAYAPCS